MNRLRQAFTLFIFILFLVKINAVCAQAPDISYSSPQTFTVNKTIAALAPANKGGAVPANAYGQVTTLAGSGVAGKLDGAGKAASFNLPTNTAVDALGNIYVSDQGNYLIRKITPSGVVSTFAGTGSFGRANGNGTSASFNSAGGMVVDASGNLYVADELNNVIREITPTGDVSTFAGSGTSGSSDGTVTTASFGLPYDVTIDGSGNMYIADEYNNKIRKITPAGIVSTLAGSGKPGQANGVGAAADFDQPFGVAVDAAGNIYVADTENNQVRKITPDGTVSTLAGSKSPGSADGKGTAASFYLPTGVTVDQIGDVYVADNGNSLIRVVDPSGNVTTLAGSGNGNADGIGPNAKFWGPVGLSHDGVGNLYVADQSNNIIREISVTGYRIDKPLPPGLTFDATTGIISGTPAAASPATNYTITAYNLSGSSSAVVNIAIDDVTPVIGAPIISYQTPQTYTVNTAITPLTPRNTGGAVPVASYGQVTTFAGSGLTGATDGTGIEASFSAPIAMTIDANGNIYVADYNNNTVRKITPAGVVTTLAGNPGVHGSADGTGPNATFAEPDGVVADKNGNVYVADSYNNLIRMITPAGVVKTFAGINGISGATDGPGINATFNSPAGLAIDNAGNIYVADKNNNMIRMITPKGAVTTVAGSTTPGSANGTGASATFNQPESLAIDLSGNIYVADTGNDLIREITPSGVVFTLAGSGSAGSSDGTGAVAGFNQPYGITIDNSGTLYVADEKNNLIRKVTGKGIVTTIAGNGSGGSIDGTGNNASFSYPGSIAADNFGNIYAGDLSTFLVRKIGLSGYTIDKPLPPGLTFDPTTGVISGVPTAPSPATDYTVTAYNAGGNGSTIVNIAVTGNAVPLPAPPNISYQTPQTYNVNTTITPLKPSNTGGAVPANNYAGVTTFAGNLSQGKVNGIGKAASFGSPVGLIFDASGNLFVSENINNDVRKITPADVVSTFAGTGTAGNTNGAGNIASFNNPYQLTIDGSGNLYAADEGNQEIRKITPAGIVSTFAGTGGQGTINGDAANATFNNPTGVTFDAAGNMYVADRGNSTIRKIDPGGQVTTFAVLDGAVAPVNDVSGLYYLGTGLSPNLYFVNTNQVEVATPAAAISVLAGSTTPGSANGSGPAAAFDGLFGIAVDAPGNIYVSDVVNNKIRKIDAAGTVVTLAGEGGRGSNDGTSASATFFHPFGLAIDPAGNFLYVADNGNNLIRKIAITGYSIDKSLPNGLSFDPSTGIISGTPSFSSPPEVYTITAYNQGGSSTTTVNIQITDEQTVSFGPLPDKTVCDADFDPGATGSGPVAYTSADAMVATIVSGKIHITGVGTSVITATDGSSQATETLTVSAAITPTISITPQSADTCQGKTIVFSAQITGGGTQPVLQWQVNGKNAGANGPEFSTDNLNNGDKITCVLTSNAPCTTAGMVTSNAAAFTLDPFISTSVNISSSATGPVCRGTPVTFTATAHSPDINPIYQWQINGENMGGNQSTFTSAGLNDGDAVTCVLTSTGKCIIEPEVTSNAITINLDPQSNCIIDIPNTFTPNGDGINDFWDITALQGYPGCVVSIFSRDGSLVYNSVNYPKPWDGTYDGKKLPVGTYYYVIDLKNGKKPLAGSVTILR